MLRRTHWYSPQFRSLDDASDEWSDEWSGEHHGARTVVAVLTPFGWFVRRGDALIASRTIGPERRADAIREAFAALRAQVEREQREREAQQRLPL